MAKWFLLGPAHVVYLFLLFLFTHFLFAKCGHSGPLSALLHTSNPLTSADSVNCLQPTGDTCCVCHRFSSVFPSSSYARGACFHNVTVLAVCAWEPQCVTLMKEVSVNASPAQSELLPVLIFCLSASVSPNTFTDHLLSLFYFISSSTTGLDFSVLCSLEGSVNPIASLLWPLVIPHVIK